MSGDVDFQDKSFKIGEIIGDLVGNSEIRDHDETLDILNSLELKIKKIFLRFTNTNKSYFIIQTEWSIKQIAQGKKLLIDVVVETGEDFKINLVLKFCQVEGEKKEAQTLKTIWEFDLGLKKDQQGSIFFAAQYKNAGEYIKLKELLGYVSESVAENIPESFEFKINQIFFAYQRTSLPQANTPSSKFLFGLELGMDLNLANLPLLGGYIPADQKFSVENLRLVYASEEFTVADVDVLKNITTSNEPSKAITPLNGKPSNNESSSSTTIESGICFQTTLYYMGNEEHLSFPIPISTQKSDNQKSTALAISPQKSILKEEPKEKGFKLEGNTLWLNLNKSWSFIELKRIGARYDNGSLFVLLDAAVSVAGLKITCDGLGVGSSLKEFDLKFKIPAIAIEYKGDAPLEIGGALYWKELTSEEEKEFKFKIAGLAIIKTEAFTMKVLAAYAKFLNGDSSFLVYGVLDKTLGGPPFLLVTGLALGFGYNRTVITPSLDKLKDFPLVKLAISDKGAGDLISCLRDLDACLPAKKGEMFLAVGIKFTSFKIINSFILLIAKFGKSFELDFLGFSTLVMPPAVPGTSIEPICKVELAIVGTFKPSEGTIKVDGKILDGSYLFSPEGRISGGFAFYAWFQGDHAGDFVLTVGGYHPLFKPPAHYPQVERMQFYWPNVKGSDLTIKGTSYFALTSSAIMAGGRFEAIWDSGNLKAYFIYEINLILAWKPFFYDAEISLKIGASYTFSVFGIRKTINVDVSANLHIWGPEFAGKAKIDLGIVEFELSFGAADSAEPPALTWGEFQESFLPSEKQICTIGVSNGLIQQIGEGENTLWVINPKYFALTTNTVIPAKQAKANSSQLEFSKPERNLGIASMQVKSKEFTTSDHLIKIERFGDTEFTTFEGKFKYEPIYKNVPVALWGEPTESGTPDLNGDSLVKKVLSGFVIKSQGVKKGNSKEISCEKLAYETTSVDNAYNWGKFAKFEQNKAKVETDLQSIQANKEKRQNMLGALGFSETEIDNIHLDEFSVEKLAQAFVEDPVLVCSP